MKRRTHLWAILALAAMLGGCIVYGRGPGISLDERRAGERLFVVSVVAERSATRFKDPFQIQKDEYREFTGRPFPDDMEMVKASEAFDIFGGDLGHVFIVPVPKSWGVEAGDILEIIHPGPNEYAKAIRIANKWNDPTPGGCYWEGSYSKAWPGRVVCKDYAPEAPERRKGYRDFVLPYQSTK